MVDSILDDVKDQLNLAADYDVFDNVIKQHINSAFSTLNDLGVGPLAGFKITSSTEVWDDFFLGLDIIEDVKSYMGLRVRLLFDPPDRSYVIDALNTQRQEFEARFKIRMDPEMIEDPDIDEDDDDLLILEGGDISG